LFTDEISEDKIFNIGESDSSIAVSIKDSEVAFDVILGGIEGLIHVTVGVLKHGTNLITFNLAGLIPIIEFEESSGDKLGVVSVGNVAV